MNGFPVVLAFAVGFFFAGLDLITAKYPRTWYLLGRCRSLWAYCVIYGAIASGVYALSDLLVASGKIQLSSEILSSVWVRAIALGICVRSLLHINLFTVRVGSQPLPIGLETFVQIFEPMLLRNIMFDEFDTVRLFIAPFAAQHPDLGTVRLGIIQNIPPALPQQESGAFKDELNKATSVTEALEQGLRFLGKKTFLRIFR